MHELLEELEVAESRRIARRDRRPGDARPTGRDLVPQRRSELGARRLAPAGRPVSGRARRATRRSCELEREIGLLLRRSRAISARLAGQLHPDLDGAAYGLLVPAPGRRPAARERARHPARPGQEHGQPAGGHLVDLGLVDRAADPVDGRAQVLTPSAEGAARLARIRDVRRARWEDDLPTGRPRTSPPWPSCCTG